MLFELPNGNALMLAWSIEDGIILLGLPRISRKHPKVIHLLGAQFLFYFLFEDFSNTDPLDIINLSYLLVKLLQHFLVNTGWSLVVFTRTAGYVHLRVFLFFLVERVYDSLYYQVHLVNEVFLVLTQHGISQSESHCRDQFEGFHLPELVD